MKAGMWSSSRGTFTSFYLGDSCRQADSIRKTGTVIATGEIMEISSWVNLFYYTILSLGSCRSLLSLIFQKKAGGPGEPTLTQAGSF